mmetsp:Transcript_18537/g.55887  ORF Transcript_18537/g.55887 Transcript_18537/m.55887 type:complete len:300 (-) Transcript_18537:1458-2357(-)
MRVTSSTPQQRSWCSVSGASKVAATCSPLGLMHRTKCSSVLSRRLMRSCSCSRNRKPTVWLPRLSCPAAMPTATSASRGCSLPHITRVRSELRVSRFLSRKLLQLYTTSPAKWSTRKSVLVDRLSYPKCGFFCQILPQLRCERGVRRLGVDALLVQKRQDADALGGPGLDEVHAQLVVLEVHVRPVDALAAVHLLLQLEQVPVELLLQALVGVVDAQLLEAVLLEALEAVDVQDGQAGAAGALVTHRQRLVDLVHQPPEERCIDGLGEGIPGVQGCLHLELYVNALATSSDFALGQRMG